ncbi:MAG: hypothetical protein CVU52_03975 [Deltaproteobacteria bacterium HGW-Deltaproteobacteria-10]|nr:MAG: hypothetical protein CVU52_03975 [Deltaproteobacteria bacterium HGW-Deltaproteobacteria-10]
MQNEFHKIDLHIHTPASNCYKGKKDDDEYLSILKKAKDRNLKIIAITDHNTIDGYKQLMEIKDNLEKAKKSLSEITDSIQVRNKLKDINEKLNLFNTILVLPGVEFEVRNGIHILVIFNNNVEIKVIEKFLTDGGYGIEGCGQEEPGIIPNWDIFSLFDVAKKYDCILIDAHTDSHKGILNTIPRGKPRAACFKSDQLTAVCYKNETQKDMLENVLRTSIEYKRNRQLSFVKFSDAHKFQDVGSEFTYVKLKNIDYESLNNAFNNPSEMVSVEEPSLKTILNKLIDEENSYRVPDLTGDNVSYFKKLVCALHNSDGGYILVGVTDNKNKTGVKITSEDIYKDQIFKIIEESCNRIDARIIINATLYALHNQNTIISLHVQKGECLTNIKDDGLIYSIRGKKLVVLTAKEIQNIIETKQLSNLEENIYTRISRIEKECHLARNYFSSIPIIHKFNEESTTNFFQLKLIKCTKLLSKDIDKLTEPDSVRNGKSKGNLFYFNDKQAPRLKYAYLRYSLPLCNVSSVSRSSDKKDYVYIIPGGAVYYSKGETHFYNPRYRTILALSLRESKAYSFKFALCFLKSSFFLWYCDRTLGGTDIFIPDIYNKIRFPKIYDRERKYLDGVKETEIIFNDIIKLEKKYLIAVQGTSNEEFIELTNKHNINVNNLAYNIDKNIYRVLGLSKEQISIIELDIRMRDIYLPIYDDNL